MVSQTKQASAWSIRLRAVWLFAMQIGVDILYASPSGLSPEAHA